MPGSLRNVISINDKSAIEPLSDKDLSIGFMPDGFLFAVMDPESLRYLLLEEYRLTHDAANEGLLQNFNDFIDSHPVLSQDFRKVHLSHFSAHYVLIPAAVYDPLKKETCFSFCSQLPENHQVHADKIEAIDAFGIYAVPNDLIRMAGERFRDFRIRHQASVLIESIFAHQQVDESMADVVLNINSSHFEVLLIHHQKLLCYKSYLYKVFDDVLFYLFYLLELYGMDANRKKLMLVGEMQADAKEVAILKNFFARVSFPRRNKSFQFSEEFTGLPAQHYFTLFNMVK